MFRRDEFEYKTPEQVQVMRRSGLVVAEILALMQREAGPGVSTADLDRLAREVMARHEATPSFLGYYGYPAVICASVNDQVVHGIPSERILANGDIVSIDVGVSLPDTRGQHWHADAAVTLLIGDQVSDSDVQLSHVTREALWAGLARAVAGGRLTDIGAAVQATVQAAGPYGIVEEYVGHGIGTAMHMAPDVPNLGPAGRGARLRPGLVIAVEPMVTLGSARTQVLEDEWTVVTIDGSRASHWEHTVALTEAGPWVLTAPDGGAERFAAAGVPSPAAAHG